MNINNEYSAEFDKLRKNRVEVSFYKYGAARDNERRNGGNADKHGEVGDNT